MHASPSAPSVDVYVLGQDTPVVEALEYGKATDYLEVPAGSYAFELRAAGADPDSEAAHVTPAIELAGGTSYSAVAAGKLGSSDLADQFRVIALEEGYEAAATGSARVRLLHAGSEARVGRAPAASRCSSAAAARAGRACTARAAAAIGATAPPPPRERANTQIITDTYKPRGRIDSVYARGVPVPP